MRIYDRYLGIPGTRRRGRGDASRRCVAALAACLAVLLAYGCNLSDVVSPNAPADLTGQNPNEDPEFNGTIVVFFAGTQVAPDGVTDVLITARARDAEGNPVQNGTPISFSTTLGTLRPVGSSPLFGASNVTLFSFNGQATVALRSAQSGVATVTAAIADVSDFVQINIDAPPISGTLSLAFATGSTAANASTSPADFELVATARDDDGSALVEVNVRFRIVKDTSRLAGSGDARLLGQGESLTDSSGRATELLRVLGAGEVVVEAELEDPNNGAAVAVSNQVIATIPETTDNLFRIALTFAGGSQNAEVSAPGNVGLVAAVTDADDEPARGVSVRFRIVSDSTGTATLARSGASRTDSDGEAFNTLNIEDVGQQVVVVAEVVDPTHGNVTTTSNQVVANGT